MAVTTAMNVIGMTANADTVTRSFDICGIKVVETAGAAAHIKIRQTNSSGTIVYEAKVASGSESWADAGIKGQNILYLEIVTGAANVYLYSK